MSHDETNKLNEIIAGLSDLSILEASKLVTMLKKEWNISDMPMMSMGSMSNMEESSSKAPEAKTNFDVILASVGEKRIDVIKIIKEITGLGLKESKDFVESAPKAIKENASKEEADNIKNKLEAVGAKIELK